MHPRLAPLVDDLEHQRDTLLTVARAHSSARLDTPAPKPGTWSPAEILDHLAVVEGGVARLLAKRLMRAKEAGLALESSTAPVRTPLVTVFLTQKVEAPENVRPELGVTAPAALERLNASRALLRETLAAADGYDLTAVTARHQIFGELNMYEWLIFLARHEQRHVAQLMRALD